jgi:hypothetical protein
LIELERGDEQKYEYLEEAVQDLEKAYELISSRKEENLTALLKETALKLKRARKLLALKKEKAMAPKQKETISFVKNLIEKYETGDKKIEYLRTFEELVAENQNPVTEVPDYYNCKISYVLLLFHQY